MIVRSSEDARNADPIGPIELHCCSAFNTRGVVTGRKELNFILSGQPEILTRNVPA
jgi:hypothetical protein